MRTPRPVALMTIVLATAITACGGSTSEATDAGATTSQAPPTSAGTTAGQTLTHLRDGSTMTQDDSARTFAITHGDSAELRLSHDYSWTDPQVAGPGELLPVTAPEDAGYTAWELVTSGPGNLVISASGAPDCESGDCNLDNIDFTVSIAVRRP